MYEIIVDDVKSSFTHSLCDLQVMCAYTPQPRRLCVRWWPSPLHQKGAEPHPIFGPRLLWSNGCMDQDATLPDKIFLSIGFLWTWNQVVTVKILVCTIHLAQMLDRTSFTFSYDGATYFKILTEQLHLTFLCAIPDKLVKMLFAINITPQWI